MQAHLNVIQPTVKHCHAVWPVLNVDNIDIFYNIVAKYVI